jgi:3-oxoacyl-[acyl-carrier protein] reductase
MPCESWDALMALNLRSGFVLSREALKAMRPRGQGSLIFISSVEGISGASCEAAYAASKAGQIGLARSLAKEYGPSGIRVNCIAPGVIDCGMMAGYSAEDREALRQATPLRRLGRPEDVAQAALFLCSEAAHFITGQVLQVDGGWAP